MASGWSPGIAIFERGRSTRRLLHLNIFTTQWHCSDDFRTGLGPFPYNSIFMTHVYRSRKEVPWNGSNKGQDEANEQLTYETDPHLLFPTLTLRQRQVYETRGSFLQPS